MTERAWPTGSLRRWVVTGPTGAGKSLLLRLLAEQGAATISADAIGHELLHRPEIVHRIEAEFGRSVVADGQVDRPALGRIVFASAAALARLGAIIHPLLALEIEACFDAHESAGQVDLAVCEAAVYFLLPSIARIELVVTVTADASIRHRRLAASGRWDDADVRRRIEAQAPLEADWERADIVLYNDGSREAFAATARRVLGPRLGRWRTGDTETGGQS